MDGTAFRRDQYRPYASRESALKALLSSMLSIPEPLRAGMPY